MKNGKKFFSVLLVLTMILSFVGCQNNTTDETTTQPTVYMPAETVWETIAPPPVTEIQTQAPITEAPTQAPVTEAPTEAPTVAPTEAPTVPPTVAPTETTTLAPTEAPTETTTEVPTETPTEAPPTTGVGKYTASYAGVEQAVFYPNSMLSSEEALPVIAWANGTGFSYTIYENLIKEIAEGGYIVVANTETMSADGIAQITSLEFAIAENSTSTSVLFNKVNTQKLAVAGHSQGGRSSVNAAAKDSRIVCVLSLAGSNFVEEAEKLHTPTLFFAGSRDLIVGAQRWIVPAYEACKGPAVYVCLTDGVHTTCSTSPQTYSGYAIKWFDAWLKNDDSAKAVFKEGGELSADSAWQDFACKGI